MITSDHGNLFGERFFPFFIRKYGHLCSTYAKKLIKTPWLVTEKGKRKEIKNSEKVEYDTFLDDSEERDIKEKLKTLGYID